MTVYTSYDVVGIKEDISDIITNISPTKTPFQSDIGNEKVHQKLFQWQQDVLRAQAANAQVEGADATFITVSPTTMRTNYTQIFMESSQVSGSLDATSLYGRAKESAYQLAKSAAAVKRDLEFAYVGSQQTHATGSDGVARQMDSAQQLINLGTDTEMGFTGPNIVYAGGSTNISEANLLTCLQNAFTVGAEPNVVYVTPSNSVIFSTFAKQSNRTRTMFDNGGGDPQKLINAVDVYVSPFGEVRIKLNRFQHTSDTLVIDTDMWSKVTLRPWTRETLAKTGDSLKQMIVGEFSLKLKHFLASGLVVDNATSGL